MSFSERNMPVTEAEQNQIFDIYYEMRGLTATLLAASRGDLQDPDRIVEYAAGQIDRFADNLASCITGKPFDSDERLDGLRLISDLSRTH